MQVVLNSNTDPVPADKPSPAAAAKAAESAASKPPAPAKQAAPAPKESVIQGGLLESNVTFRRDANGQIYYVITDAKSGKELRQVPTEEIRKIGEGIAEFLKREQEKSTPHLEVKA